MTTTTTPDNQASPTQPEIDDYVPEVVASDLRRAVGSRWQRLGQNLKKNLKQVVVAGAVGLAVGLLINMYVLRGVGNAPQSGVFWFVVMLLASMSITNIIMSGPSQFFSDIAGYPKRIVKLVKDAGDTALVHVLFGFAGGTLITWLLGPWASGALAIGVLVSLATFIRPIVVGGAMVAWRAIVVRVAPKNPAATPPEAMTVTILGSSTAMALAVFLHNMTTRLIIGGIAVVLAVGLSVTARRSTSDQEPQPATGPPP